VSDYKHLGALINSDLSLQNIIVGDMVLKSMRAVEALDFVLGGRDIPINVRTSVLIKSRIVPVLTYGCEVSGMDTTRGVNTIQTLLNQFFRRLVGVVAKAPGVATTSLLWELGIAPIEATAAAARDRAFL
jgi:hypothetical protein